MRVRTFARAAVLRWVRGGPTIDSVPLVLVFTLGQLHDLAEAAASQSGLGILSQLVTGCSLLAAGSRAELVPPVVAPVCT